MEKSWNFEIRAKSHGSGVYVDKEVMDFCDSVMEKSWKSHGILSRKFRGNPESGKAITIPWSKYYLKTINISCILYLL